MTALAAWDALFGVEHSPKPTVPASRRAAGVMDDRTRELHPALWAADFNRRETEVHHDFPGYQAHLAEVVGILTDPRQLQMRRFRAFDVIPGAKDDDHPGLTCQVRPVHGDHAWLTVGFVNLIGAMDNTDRGPFGERMLTVVRNHVLELGGGLILAVEADDVRVSRVLDPKVWKYAHQNGHDRDGVLMAITRADGTLSHPVWHDGAPGSPENAPRPILTATVHVKAA